MKTGKFGNIMALASEVMRQHETAQDVIMNTSEVTVKTEEGTPFLIGHNPLDGQRINTHAIHQMGSHLGIHRSYLEKMRVEAPALLDQNLNQWHQVAEAA